MLTELDPMRRFLAVAACCAMFVAGAEAQTGAQNSGAPAPGTAPNAADEYSGMYSFLQEGEFVQITIEEQGKVTGFVSRYGDAESDKGAFLNHFLKQGKLDGQNLSFATEVVHGVWFEFKGQVERGPAKTRKEDGYYVLKGSLTEYTKGDGDKVSAKQRDVQFKLFPPDTESSAGNKKP